MTYSVRLDDDALSAYLKKLPSDITKGVQVAIDSTAIYAKQQITINLPKRTGNLRKSYLIKKTGKLSREVSSDSVYADAVEFGSRAKTIRPKRAKMLTIPLRDSVLVGTKARISQTALNRLFSELKNKANRKKKRSQIYQEVGIALAKKANIPAVKGQFSIKNKVLPTVDRFYLQKIMAEIEKIV